MTYRLITNGLTICAKHLDNNFWLENTDKTILYFIAYFDTKYRYVTIWNVPYHPTSMK